MPHSLIPEGLDGTKEVGVIACPLNLETNDGVRIGDDKKHGGSQGECESMVNALVGRAVQFRAAAFAACHPAGRKGNLLLEQVTFVTGYYGRTQHIFTTTSDFCTQLQENLSYNDNRLLVSSIARKITLLNFLTDKGLWKVGRTGKSGDLRAYSPTM